MIRKINRAELQDRLTAFETKYAMTTAEFLNLWTDGKLDYPETNLEPPDFIDWAIVVRALEQTTK